MLLYKIKELEYSLEKDKMKNEAKLNIVSSLKNTLLKIDFRTEVIPEYSYDKIIQVLEDINGKVLSFEEKQIIQDVIPKQGSI
jgi:tRNA A-37 threonylcarbamoyl transferase component Bud32